LCTDTINLLSRAVRTINQILTDEGLSTLDENQDWTPGLYSENYDALDALTFDLSRHLDKLRSEARYATPR
jgi:hypothetical protein